MKKASDSEGSGNGLMGRASRCLCSLNLEKTGTGMYCCCKTVLHEHLTFLYILQGGPRATFVLEYLFKGVCMANVSKIFTGGGISESKLGS